MIDSGIFLNGDEVRAFEEEFSAYCGTAHCVACASGTDALTLMGSVSGFDKVKVQANTCKWTEKGLRNAGLTVNIADCGTDGRVSTGLDNTEGAVIPVMLYGAWNVNWVEQACRFVDACQAHGWKPRKEQSGAFSFYPTKNVGGPGDGGAFITGDAEMARKARIIAKAMHSRMSEMTAALLRVRLPRLDEWNSERNRLAGIYYENLPSTVDPAVSPKAESNHHLFVVQTEHRDTMQETLLRNEIGTAIHYCDPLDDRPNAQRWCQSILSLPLWVGMKDEDVRFVCDCL